MGYISLALDDYFFEIATFGDTCFAGQEAFPRLRMERESVEITDHGNFVDYGSAYEDPHMYDFSALMPLNQAYKLQSMYDEYRWRVRQKDVVNYNPDILLIDAYQPYEERVPLTRATAPAPFDVITYSGTGGSKAQYYARFYVRFIKRPEFKQEGGSAIVQLSLQETERKVSP